MEEQLKFDLPVRTTMGRDDFFVSPSNALAVALIEGWATWPQRKLLLTGQTGAGKTHLAHVWADLAGAQIIAARDLPQAEIPALAPGHVVIEDIDALRGDAAAQNALFHLHNLSQAEGGHILFTAQTPAASLNLELADLQSRLRGTQAIEIDPPDDALFAAVLMKLFQDRQLSPTPGTLPYLVRRLERSFDAARLAVEALDAASLEQKRPITRDLARQVVDNSTPPPA